MEREYIGVTSFWVQLRALTWKNFILKKRSWPGLIFECLFGLVYILVSYQAPADTKEAGKIKLSAFDFMSKPMISVGLCMFPIYQIMYDKSQTRGWIRHLVTQNVNPYAYYLSYYLGQLPEISTYLAIMVGCKLSKGDLPPGGTLLVLASTLSRLLLTLTLCILCQSLLCSRPHHTSLTFFYCSIVLLMITDPLSVALSDTLLGPYAELVTLSTFLLALLTILLVAVYLKHRDFFTSSVSRLEEDIALEMEDTLVEVRNLNLTMGKDRVLSRLDMAIKEGEIMGLLGANGAGKTTLIKVLLGEVGKVPAGSEVYMKGPKGEVISIKRDLK
jgi:hypothetical protein